MLKPITNDEIKEDIFNVEGVIINTKLINGSNTPLYFKLYSEVYEKTPSNKTVNDLHEKVIEFTNAYALPISGLNIPLDNNFNLNMYGCTLNVKQLLDFTTFNELEQLPVLQFICKTNDSEDLTTKLQQIKYNWVVVFCHIDDTITSVVRTMH